MNTDGSSPLSVEKRVDEACDRFEAAWQARQRPRIEDYLPDFASRERSAFLRKLLLVEIELRRSDGENPTPDDYLERFLQDHDLIQSIFKGFSISVERVVITELRNSTYFARLILQQQNEVARKIVEIDARPSDCLALATAQKRPIYVTSSLFDQVEDMSEVLDRINESGNAENE